MDDPKPASQDDVTQLTAEVAKLAADLAKLAAELDHIKGHLHRRNFYS